MTTPSNYSLIISGLKERIRQARLKAASLVNAELLKVYWEIGHTIVDQQNKEGWGAKVIDRLAADLKAEFPDFKGLSVRNLKYMRSFAEVWPEFPKMRQPAAQVKGTENQSDIIVQQLAAQIPWGHHQVLLDRVKDPAERAFYIQKAVENGWSRNVMVHQIETGLFKRSGKAITNFQHTLPILQSDLAQQAIKNPYVFDFLSLSEDVKEKELEKALIEHLKKFMLELGKGFAWVGSQKNLVVEGDDFYLDLLFYNYHMHCFVNFELKVGEFKPEFAGKLNFYVNAIDQQLKGESDNPTIGILLCKTPNETVIKYSLQGIESPIGVSSYQFEKAIPQEVKSELPSVEELEKELEQGYEELKKPADKKIDRLKDLLQQLKEPEVTESKSPETVQRYFEKLIPILKNKMMKRYQPIGSWFQQTEAHIFLDSQGFSNFDDAQTELGGRKKYAVQKISIDFQHNGFRKAGTQAFNCRSSIALVLQEFKYHFLSEKSETVLLEKLYHEMPTPEEEDRVVESWFEELLDDIEKKVEQLKRN